MLRIVQYNIHRFLHPTTSTSTLPHVIQALQRLKPDVLTLNEMDITTEPKAFQALASALQLPYVEFYGHVNGRYGNAILSKHPLKRTVATTLRGGTSFEFPPGTLKLNGTVAEAGETHRIVRGLLVCEIAHPQVGDICVGCTHLDHIDIEQRKIQFQHIMELLHHATTAPVLLCGDFNALERNDYTDLQWAGLEQRAAANHWNPPSSGDLQQLTQHGYVDSGRSSKNVNSDSNSDSNRPPPCTAPTTTPEPLYRIDYLWTKSTPQIDVACLNHTVDRATTCSDHYPLVVDVALTKKKTTRRDSGRSSHL